MTVPVLADRIRPDWCGRCDAHTRQVELADGRAARCTDCHPLTVERWLPIVDWEGFYEVSDLGRAVLRGQREAMLPGGTWAHVPCLSAP